MNNLCTAIHRLLHSYIHQISFKMFIKMKLCTLAVEKPHNRPGMRFSNLLLFTLFLMTGSFVWAQNPIYTYQNYRFTSVAQTEATSVKNQQHTGTCWSFTTTSFLESEMIRMGKAPVDLSEMFTVRNIYREKAATYIRRQGKANFSEGGLSHDVMNAYSKYGAVPQINYSGLLPGRNVYDHTQMVGALKGMLDGLMKAANGTLEPEWQQAAPALLDVYLGAPPETFTYDNKSYTAITFAREVVGINPDDYVELTSFTHVPYYHQFVLDIPDNFSNGIYYNVTLKDLTATMEYALQHGFSVAWDGDVSEPTFSARHGMALLPLKEWSEMTEMEQTQLYSSPGAEKDVTPAMRQETYNTYQTTDDHLMHIIGMVKDQEGKIYYRTKNSWGEIGPFEGYLFMSKPYVELKTVGIMIHKDALPPALRKKLDL